jgi:uncharacterized protein YaiI (UPF0178 family)
LGTVHKVDMDACPAIQTILEDFIGEAGQQRWAFLADTRFP